ncbi:hypoxanthine phosphoribosyltransferase [Candidatus Pantoea edessiphila]|uniref:Hypoxanthine phosphoribosyltransferase n=1 Tax=Candidatus Pantoea edessiphila TaxID=2044610 RepID=A0A2P5SY13_9GAMM|nr:hypoxanthine phosphoribosyltransferase [Candidatus Pantoea edessiphila]MBK4775579.1 hypoxanthine phosphoribosyltransferase [Pantoea sp. Edef]PPI87231.1 hypoxanthine phosphoribosyltransferase [Candidatus Pantoea edessiphila]
MKHIIEVMIPEKTIAMRIIELGNDINNYYNGRNNNIVVVGLLRGSFMFMADLCRVIKVPHRVDFITASSYFGMSRADSVKILKDLDEDIRDKDVLLVEDIIDSGNTLRSVYNILKSRQPKSLIICTLLDKLKERNIKINIEYVGFIIPDEFVVGFGIDYKQKYRNLPYIGKVIKIN